VLEQLVVAGKAGAQQLTIFGRKGELIRWKSLVRPGIKPGQTGEIALARGLLRLEGLLYGREYFLLESVFRAG
jgi:hypothetical protein